ncbi:hypothetical protein C8R45DRAFT_955169 [Mycena sanguinolenta]|nr:hypothetical protein C8R45DRAFT_955169 [Mycena sanguinolenta]
MDADDALCFISLDPTATTAVHVADRAASAAANGSLPAAAETPPVAAQHPPSPSPAADPAVHPVARLRKIPAAIFLVACTLAMPLSISLASAAFTLLRIVWIALLLWILPFEGDPNSGITYACGWVCTMLFWMLSWCDGGREAAIFRVAAGSFAATGAYVISTQLRRVDVREMGLLGRALLLVVSRPFIQKLFYNAHFFHSRQKPPLPYP